MTQRPEDRPEERRRTGPLGDDDDAEQTRRVPTGENRPVSGRREQPDQTDDAAETRQVPQGSPEGNGDKDTRVIRTPGYPDTTADATPYPR